MFDSQNWDYVLHEIVTDLIENSEEELAAFLLSASLDTRTYYDEATVLQTG